MFYSKSTNGFYDTNIHGTNMPADAVEITDATYSSLMAAQAGGKIIQANSKGAPVAVAPSAPTSAQLADDARKKRDELLTGCDWTQLPDAPAGVAAKYAPYRQALRDWPSSAGFPDLTTLPAVPV